jgi:hypothetical protein
VEQVPLEVAPSADEAVPAPHWLHDDEPEEDHVPAIH